MQYIYLLLILSVLFSIIAVFNHKILLSIISFALLILSIVIIGIMNNNILSSFVLLICYMSINCFLILIDFYKHSNLGEYNIFKNKKVSKQ